MYGKKFQGRSVIYDDDDDDNNNNSNNNNNNNSKDNNNNNNNNDNNNNIIVQIHLSWIVNLEYTCLNFYMEFQPKAFKLNNFPCISLNMYIPKFYCST